MGKIIRNGVDYSGLIVINESGVFIDTNNVIETLVGDGSMKTYTATEDCVVAGTLVGTSNNSPALLVDGVTVAYVNQNYTIGACIYIKKGQVLSYRMASTGTNLKVFGIQQGSNILPDYSTTEHKTGRRWIDGKDIYEKTIPFTFSSAVGDWTLFDGSVSYDKLLNTECMLINEQYQECHTFVSNYNTVPRWVVRSDHKLYYYTNESVTRTGYITVQYTKT